MQGSWITTLLITMTALTIAHHTILCNQRQSFITQSPNYPYIAFDTLKNALFLDSVGVLRWIVEFGIGGMTRQKGHSLAFSPYSTLILTVKAATVAFVGLISIAHSLYAVSFHLIRANWSER